MFKTDKIFLIAMLLLCSASFSLSAEEQGYRLPNDITQEEWNWVMGKKNEYNGCLKEEMIASVDKGNDARQVANQVLELCSFHLIEIQKQMDKDNIQPEFTRRFIYNTKNQAGKQMLGGIMMLMAQKQARVDEEQSGSGITDDEK